MTASATIRAPLRSLTPIILVTFLLWVIGEGSNSGVGEQSSSNPLRYIIYTLPFSLLLANAFQPRRGPDDRAVLALVVYLFAASAAAAAAGTYDFLTCRDIFIVGSYLMLFALRMRFPAEAARSSLLVIAAGFLIQSVNQIAARGIPGGIDGWIGPDGILETQLAFPAGLLFLFFFRTRRVGLSILAALILLLAFKRSAFLGILAATSFDLAARMFLPRGLRPVAALLLVLGIAVAALFSLQIFEFFAGHFDPDGSANGISLGRYMIAEWLWRDIARSDLISLWIGHGPGGADGLVLRSFDLGNPHNDWLKIFYDYGILGWLMLHAVLFLIFARGQLGLMLYLYTAVLVMTDNVFVYLFHQIFAVLVMGIDPARYRRATGSPAQPQATARP